jgi:chromosome segregation ATPase
MPGTPRSLRPSRDSRMDSTPPSRPDEAPLGRRSARPTLAPQPPEYPAPAREGRMALLEAELERLRSERASEADETAGMLVHIAESERMRVSAQSQAVEAGERAGVLEARLEAAQRQIHELEAEVAGARTLWAASQAELTSAREQLTSTQRQLASTNEQLTSAHEQQTATNEQLTAARAQLTATGEQLTSAREQLTSTNQELASAREQLTSTNQQLASAREQLTSTSQELASANESMASALEMLEEMERREEMAASMRTRGLRDAVRALGRVGAGSAPERVSVAPDSTVEIVGTHDVEWDLELAE